MSGRFQRQRDPAIMFSLALPPAARCLDPCEEDIPWLGIPDKACDLPFPGYATGMECRFTPAPKIQRFIRGNSVLLRVIDKTS